LDVNCNWSGALSTASVTCTGKNEGALATNLANPTETATSSVVLSPGNVTALLDTAVLVTATGSASPSGAAASSSSSGFAAAMALPTGGVALVGGAAGLLAALAL
jgi:hypothetical protein